MSSSPQKTTESASNKLGQSLRDVRKQRGMTLAEASERAGLPVSTLSKIENNRMSLSYDKMLRICQALEIDIAQLFAGDASAPAVATPVPSGRRSVNRGGSGYAIKTANYSHLYPAADLLNKRVVPIIAEIHTRSLKEFGDLIRHSGEEYAYVLEGSVDLYTDLYAPMRLDAGDSIYFDSGMGHAYIAVSEGVCRVLSVCSAEHGAALEAHGGDSRASERPAPAPVPASPTPIRAPRVRKG